MRPLGKVNPLTVLLFLAIAGGLYWVVRFLPLYIDNMEIEDAVNVAFNSFGGDFTADKVRYDMKVKFQQAKWGVHQELDPATGEMKEKPGLDIPDEQIITEYDETTNQLTIRVTYDREVTLVPSNKKRTVHFVVERVGPPKKDPVRR